MVLGSRVDRHLGPRGSCRPTSRTARSRSCCRARRATSTTSSTATARSTSGRTGTRRTSGSSTAPLADPSPARWKTVVERTAPDVLLDDVEVFRDYLVVPGEEAGLNRLRVRRSPTARGRRSPSPSRSTPRSPRGTPEFDLDAAALRLPEPHDALERLRLRHGSRASRTLLKREEVLGGFDPSRYASERLWATARDGVKVPISIVYRKGARPRRHGAALALRLRLVRLRHVGDVRLPPRQPARPRRRRSRSRTSAAATRWARPGTTTGC